MKTSNTTLKLARSATTTGLLLLGILALGLSGCTTRFVDYTMLSTKNMDLSKAGTYKRGANRVRGEDTQMIIIFIPTASAPNVKEATDRAIESVPGAVALVDGVGGSHVRMSWRSASAPRAC